MELNITQFYNQLNPHDYSASIAERGENAGKETWDAANEAAKTWVLLDTPEKIAAFKKWVEGFGAWDDAEINAWDDDETNALLIQFISGDIKDCCLADDPDDWEGLQAEVDAGSSAGNLFKGEDGEIYFFFD